MASLWIEYIRSKAEVWGERISPAVTRTEAVAVLVVFVVAKVDIIPCRAKKNTFTRLVKVRNFVFTFNLLEKLLYICTINDKRRMNYPLISEYIEAIKAAEDNFEELSYLRPVLGDDGMPVMTSGNFAVVFKMKDEETGKLYALKCFTKEQEGRAEAYHQIAEELKDVDSPYLVSLRYLDKELFVDTDQTSETGFPVLLMDWVEGKTLDKYLRENLHNKYALEMQTYRFSQLAQWLIPQPFAHGDLKPDNILVREDGTLVLVDYDGMYVPAMKGQKARELGSPDFRHPLRTEKDFDEHIDGFPLVSILLSLKAISHKPWMLDKFGTQDRLIFSKTDYLNIESSVSLNFLINTEDRYMKKLVSAFTLCITDSEIFNLHPALLDSKESYKFITTVKENPLQIGARVDGGHAIYSDDGDRLLLFGDTIGGWWGEHSISDYKIRQNTAIICDNALKNNHYLAHLLIPSSVMYIGSKAFAGCAFNYIEIPYSILYINKNAFDDCPNLSTIVLPKGRLSFYANLLPYDISRLVEVDKALVLRRLRMFFNDKRNKDLCSYYDILLSLFINNKVFCFEEITKNFHDIQGPRCYIRYRVKSSGVNEYTITDIHDLDEIVNAIYYILLDLGQVELILNNRILSMIRDLKVRNNVCNDGNR